MGKICLMPHSMQPVREDPHLIWYAEHIFPANITEDKAEAKLNEDVLAE